MSMALGLLSAGILLIGLDCSRVLESKFHNHSMSFILDGYKKDIIGIAKAV